MLPAIRSPAGQLPSVSLLPRWILELGSWSFELECHPPDTPEKPLHTRSIQSRLGARVDLLLSLRRNACALFDLRPHGRPERLS